ncbi:MAG TPA: FAD:protein FMN transferase [Acidimicrobiales bacterium]|jgi:thiamine biosynthesis lipoprotein|nr:FAD:protein FMN transferase [Acidimicrobiales bacterium]
MTATELAEDLIRHAEQVMGTVVSIHVRPGPVPPDQVWRALAEARHRLHRADAVFSTWKSESPMSRLRRGEITLSEAPAEMASVLDRCSTAKEWSAGWFDPWAAPAGVDPTGLVKGWAAHQSLRALADAGVEAAMVSAGGDVATFGERAPARPWRIGVQNPFDRATIAAVVESPGAVATSGAYERGHHVFDPFRGTAADHLASATVTGPELDLADALATGLLAGGRPVMERICERDGYQAMVIGLDGTITATAGFPRV